MKKILAIDDSATNVALLTGVLSEIGYEIENAPNGKDALKIMEKSLPDLILLDLMMPRLNGFQFLEIMAASESFKKVPVIVISARTNSQSIKQAMDLGAKAFLKKPVDIDELVEQVELLLQ